MSGDTLAATFIIVFRETLEAGLIVGIILTMLSRLRAMRYASYVWTGTAAALAASAAAGWAMATLAGAATGRWEQFIEGAISLAACGVLTWMVFWMDRQARRLRPELEGQVEGAVSRRELPALVLLPFFAVFREGAETVLFLGAVAARSSQAVSIIGGTLGALLAAAVTALICVGGRKVPLQALFRWTGVLLLVIGAGLLAYGVHELEELGWLPPLIPHVWNINHLLNEKEGVGSFLKALFGYNGNPSLLEVLAYASYLVGVSLALRRVARTDGAPPPARPMSIKAAPSA